MVPYACPYIYTLVCICRILTLMHFTALKHILTLLSPAGVPGLRILWGEIY